MKKGHLEYQQINRLMKNKVRIAKENWLSEQCREMEDLNLHKKIKEAAGVYRPCQFGILLDAEDRIILDVNDKLKQL